MVFYIYIEIFTLMKMESTILPNDYQFSAYKKSGNTKLYLTTSAAKMMLLSFRPPFTSYVIMNVTTTTTFFLPFLNHSRRRSLAISDLLLCVMSMPLTLWEVLR